MTYEFWYDVAEYMNKINKGGFTAREIAINAYEYMCEWKLSLEVHMVRETIERVINILERNGSEEANEILKEINYNIDKYELI